MGEFYDRSEVGRERQRALLHDLRHYVAAGLLLYDDDDELTEVELRSRLRTGQLLFHQLSAVVDREAVGVAPPPRPIDVGELVEDCVSIFRHGHRVCGCGCRSATGSPVRSTGSSSTGRSPTSWRTRLALRETGGW